MSFVVDDRSSGLVAPALLCAAAAIGLIVQLMVPLAAPPPIVQPKQGSSDARAALTLPTPTRDDPAIGHRPLFSPARADAAKAPAGAFALLGVASGAGRASAVLHASDGLHTLRLGDTLEGWRLVAIGAERAALRRDGRVQELHVGAIAAGAR